MKKNISIVILITVLSAVSIEYTAAIPAFARKYQISCQVCHSPAMPRLKAFGDDFAGNGFRMTEYESPRYLIPAGDDKLSLLRELPLAIRIDGFASFNYNNNNGLDFKAPFVVKILSGGELSDKLSYYFYFLFNERGGVAGIEDALLNYSNLFGTGINVTFGQFQVCDPMFKSETRYTLEPYMIYAASPGNSTTDLKYDRGIVLDKGFSTGTSVILQVLNGYGIREAGDDWQFDKDKYKNFMVRLGQDAGPLSIGLFGYSGKETIFTGIPGSVNDIWMFGPDISLNVEDRFVLNVQYVVRNDEEVFTSTGIRNDLRTHGGFIEMIISPKGDLSSWYLTGLLNYIESEDNSLDYTSATLHFGYLMRRNVRLVAEYSHILSGEKYGRLSAGFVAAF